jgi:Protein of unknown function (DUF1236)
MAAEHASKAPNLEPAQARDVFVGVPNEETGGHPEEAKMKKLQLLSTVAAALVLAAGTAAAQTKEPTPERAPAAQQHAPAEKIAPSMHAGEHKRKPETTGQAIKSEENGKAEPNHESGAAKSESKDGVKENAGSKSRASHQSSESATGKSSTTGQGAAATAGQPSSQQRTKITTIIKKQKVKPAHLNISVHVGVAVPASVHFYPLPLEVVDVYPEWRGYDFILVGDEIIIVNPRSHRVVAILET